MHLNVDKLTIVAIIKLKQPLATDRNINNTNILVKK